ncbi:MAG: hypothetical protein DCF15_17015 [Phormidesmis priestleyi]|uniref:Uncharacterized protein n=1 Tax=Phormidesmis priestleyi TaxID=268141 RepID=A0A2W4Z2P2_9CYAN|nr:MAG: hypothetical protein DCF15_17015 [Phormidesmis priestleyi]
MASRIEVKAIALIISLWLLWIPAQAEAGSLNALELTNESINYALSTSGSDGIAKPRKNSRDILRAARQQPSALKGSYPTALESLHSAVLTRTTRLRQQIEQITLEQLNPSDRLRQGYQTSVAHVRRFLVSAVEGIADKAHQTAEKLRQ